MLTPQRARPLHATSQPRRPHPHHPHCLLPQWLRQLLQHRLYEGSQCCLALGQHLRCIISRLQNHLLRLYTSLLVLFRLLRRLSLLSGPTLVAVSLPPPSMTTCVSSTSTSSVQRQFLAITAESAAGNHHDSPGPRSSLSRARPTHCHCPRKLSRRFGRCHCCLWRQRRRWGMPHGA